MNGEDPNATTFLYSLLTTHHSLLTILIMKLWEKNYEINKEIERFTVGRDREMDLYLAKYDVLGSMAHITMLESIGLIGKDELPLLLAELKLAACVLTSSK